MDGLGLLNCFLDFAFNNHTSFLTAGLNVKKFLPCGSVNQSGEAKQNA